MSSASVTGEPIHIGALSIHFLVEPEASAGSISVFRVDLRAGARVPTPHSHDAFDETVYGLQGVSRYTVDGTQTDLRPGDTLFIPRGTVHGFTIEGEEDASVLCMVSPGLFGPSYFTDMRDVLAVAGDGPPDLAEVTAVMLRHGLTPAPPA